MGRLFKRFSRRVRHLFAILFASCTASVSEHPLGVSSRPAMDEKRERRSKHPLDRIHLQREERGRQLAEKREGRGLERTRRRIELRWLDAPKGPDPKRRRERRSRPRSARCAVSAGRKRPTTEADGPCVSQSRAIRFRVERHHKGTWTLVSDKIYAEGPLAHQVAVARAAVRARGDPGLYRVREADGPANPFRHFELPHYGQPIPLQAEGEA